jgi:hypothetical protein
VTGGTISVSAQWALHGKGPEGEGYRILSCSNGDLSMANFADALGRFSMGVLDALPQVSVSYLQPAARRPGGSYLALGIDWFATDGQRYANGALPHDELGRKTAFTSYFCTPYRPLAEQAATYQDMYRAFSAITLPVSEGPPQQVTIKTSALRTPAIDGLAMCVAPLLLTGAPVCVLGADGTSMDERLRFIDTVMGLLPYGFRARMTAATWTRSTYREHRFRLFFSNAPRTDQLDHVVTWGEPDLVRLRGQAKDYFDWLADKVTPLTRLAELSELSSDLKFDKTALTKALELVDLQTRRRIRPVGQYLPLASRGRDREVPQLPAAQSAPSAQQPALAAVDEIAEALQECADYVRDENLSRLRSITTWLAKQAETDSWLKRQAETDDAMKPHAEAVDSRRRRYREQIRDYGLLKQHGLGNREKDLYAALLAVAFGRPLTYPGYCRVEDCVNGNPEEHLHPALLHAIKEGEMAFETKAIVLYLTRQERNEKDLNKWYGSGEVDPIVLIHWLAKDRRRPHHARVICDLTLDYLRKAPTRYDQKKVRAALRQHGFLAHALHLRNPDKEQYQISVLFQLIRAAYPGVPTREAICQILTGTSNPPTPALLAAVLMSLSSTVGDIQFAQEAYLHGSLTLMNILPETYNKLRELVPALDSPLSCAGDEAEPGQLPGLAMTSEPLDLDQS